MNAFPGQLVDYEPFTRRVNAALLALKAEEDVAREAAADALAADLAPFKQFADDAILRAVDNGVPTWEVERASNGALRNYQAEAAVSRARARASVVVGVTLHDRYFDAPALPKDQFDVLLTLRAANDLFRRASASGPACRPQRLAQLQDDLDARVRNARNVGVPDAYTLQIGLETQDVALLDASLERSRLESRRNRLLRYLRPLGEPRFAPEEATR